MTNKRKATLNKLWDIFMVRLFFLVVIVQLKTLGLDHFVSVLASTATNLNQQIGKRKRLEKCSFHLRSIGTLVTPLQETAATK